MKNQAFHTVFGLALILMLICGYTTDAQEVYKPEIKDRKNTTYKIQVDDGEATLKVKEVKGALILGGDIVLRPAGIQEAIGVRSFKRWEDGIIPYKIAPNHPQRTQILRAIATLNSMTVLWYREATSVSEKHIYIINGSGCYSGIGKPLWGDAYEVSIGGCGYGSIIHELLHAAGLYHEHQRFDRDDHVKILWDNIVSSEKSNFERPSRVLAKDIGDYNYASVMHYPCKAYAKEQGLFTILSPLHPIGQRTGLSAGDIAAIKKMYHDISPNRNKPSFPKEDLPPLEFTCKPAVWPPSGSPAVCDRLNEQLKHWTDSLRDAKTSKERKEILQMIGELKRQKDMRNCR